MRTLGGISTLELSVCVSESRQRRMVKQYQCSRFGASTSSVTVRHACLGSSLVRLNLSCEFKPHRFL